MTGEPDTEWLMRHDAPKPHRRRLRWPLRVTPPKCPTCRKQPPACECEGES